MKQGLSHLVNVILERLEKQPSGASEHGIRTWLLRQGYTPRDIDAAMSMVRRRPGSIPSATRATRFRHLSDYESMRLSHEARAALGRLEYYELIEPGERDAMLERMDQFEGVVGLGDIEYLVTWIVCPKRDIETQQTIFSVLDGKTGRVH